MPEMGGEGAPPPHAGASADSNHENNDENDNNNDNKINNNNNNNKQQNPEVAGEGWRLEEVDEPELVSSTTFDSIEGKVKVQPKGKESSEEVDTLRQELEEARAKNSALQSQKEEEMRRTIAVLTEQVASKGMHVSNLMKEIDRRTEAIRSCGEVIVKLRGENKELSDGKAALASKIDGAAAKEEREMARIESLVREEGFWGDLPPALVRQMMILTSKYSEQTSAAAEKDKEIERLNDELDAYKEREEKLAEAEKLESRRVKAEGKVKKLEGKLEAYKATIMIQEKVIAKLESVIESKVREDKLKGPAAWAMRDIEGESRSLELEREVEELSVEIEESRRVLAEVEEREEKVRMERDRLREAVEIESRRRSDEASRGVGPGGDDSAALREKLEVCQLQLSALTTTLEGNARAAQEEISALKVKILELEMGEAGEVGEEIGKVLGMSGSSSLASLLA